MLVRKVQDRKNAIQREDAYDGGMCVIGGGVGWGGCVRRGGEGMPAMGVCVRWRMHMMHVMTPYLDTVFLKKPFS